MSAATWAWLAAAGALGAVCRMLLDAAVSRRAPAPWGTHVVNVLGSLGAGVVAGLALRGAVPPEVVAVAAVGFLGAFTTFSTWMVQTAALLEERRFAAVAGSLLSLPVGAAAVLAGIALSG
jgi:fluoride exporter